MKLVVSSALIMLAGMARTGTDVGEAEPMQDAGHPERHRGLAGAGISGERHVQRGIRVGERHLLANAFDQEKRSDLADPGFHRNEADQLAIELRQDRGDIDRLELAPEVDGGDRGLACFVLSARHGL